MVRENRTEVLIVKIYDWLRMQCSLFLGWIELFLKSERNDDYKFVMTEIELKEFKGRYASIVHYKAIGCRNILSEYAFELNKLAVFRLFRPDHAQIIVSIATIESVIDNPHDQILRKYYDYLSHCNIKLN